MHLFLKFAPLRAARTFRGLLGVGVLAALGACSEGANTPTKSGSESQPDVAGSPAHLQTSTAAAATKNRVTTGSMGGSLRLDDRTGAIYSIELRDGAAFLQGVAVLRGTQRGWYDTSINAERKTMNNPGIGASLGQHLVVVTPRADAMWVDDALKVSLSDANIALFEGAGDQLTQVGSVSIDSYLGPAPLEDERQRKALVQGRLAELLKNTAAIDNAWSY